MIREFCVINGRSSSFGQTQMNTILLTSIHIPTLSEISDFGTAACRDRLRMETIYSVTLISSPRSFETLPNQMAQRARIRYSTCTNAAWFGVSMHCPRFMNLLL